LAGLDLTIRIVSTVLWPVGPHEPRVYWIRRGVFLVVIVAIIVLVVSLLSGGGSNKPTSGPHSSPSPSTSTSSPPVTPPAVAACNPSVVTLVLSTSASGYTSGESATLIGAFSNPSTTPCRLTSTPSDETWTITSGSDHIWTTKGCASTLPAKTIKIKAGGTKSIQMVWDGHRLNSGCTAGSAALPGEYVLHATLDGVKGKPAVFHVTS